MSFSLLRIGVFLADTLLLLQIIALVACVAWLAGYTTDIVGLIIVGGSIVGILSVFAFIAFGLLSYAHYADFFWRAPHALNLALSMMVSALYYAAVNQQIVQLSWSALIGVLAAVACFNFLPKSARWQIVLCFVALTIRFFTPWSYPYRHIVIAGIGIFILMLWGRGCLFNKESATAQSQ